MLSSLDLSTFADTSIAAAANKCLIRKGATATYIMYLVTDSNAMLSTNGGISFTATAYKFIDMIANADFSLVWAITSTGLYKSTNFGASWVAVVVAGVSACIALSWMSGTSIFIQTAGVGGVIYYPDSGTTAAWAGAIAVENISSGARDARSNAVARVGSVLRLRNSGTLFELPVGDKWSDEPDGSSVFASKHGTSPWYDETGKEIKPKVGTILYVCRTYNVTVEKSGQTYYVYI